jgi:hypothetical protein
MARILIADDSEASRSALRSLIQGNRWEVCGEAGYFRHESLTIFTFVTFKCPCSELLFLAPVSFAMSFVSSFKLCRSQHDQTRQLRVQ